MAARRHKNVPRRGVEEKVKAGAERIGRRRKNTFRNPVNPVNFHATVRACPGFRSFASVRASPSYLTWIPRKTAKKKNGKMERGGRDVTGQVGRAEKDREKSPVLVDSL